jgi:hypothetical protein
VGVGVQRSLQQRPPGARERRRGSATTGHTCRLQGRRLVPRRPREVFTVARMPLADAGRRDERGLYGWDCLRNVSLGPHVSDMLTFLQ